MLRRGHVLHHPGALERFQKKEAQRGQLLGHANGLQFAVREEMGLVMPDVLQSQTVGRRFEILSELLDGAQVNPSRNLGHIATLEFLQHRFS